MTAKKVIRVVDNTLCITFEGEKYNLSSIACPGEKVEVIKGDAGVTFQVISQR